MAAPLSHIDPFPVQFFARITVLTVPRCLNRQRDPNTNLNPKNIVRRSAQFRVLPDIAVQIYVIDPREIL